MHFPLTLLDVTETKYLDHIWAQSVISVIVIFCSWDGSAGLQKIAGKSKIQVVQAIIAHKESKLTRATNLDQIHSQFLTIKVCSYHQLSAWHP